MSFKKMRDFSHTLSFRLAIWYAGIFLVSMLLLLSIFYYYITSNVIKNMDLSLEEEMREFCSLMDKSGLQSVKKYMAIEVESEAEDVFFRLVSADGQEIDMATNYSFKDVQLLDKFIPLVKNNAANIFATIHVTDYPNRLRVVSGEIGQGVILQTGQSFEYYEKFISILNNFLFLVALPLFVLSTIVGWFMSRQALKDIEKVTLTAEKIAQGDYNQRVELQQSTLEVEKLAHAFNNMLDRIQALIKGLKEVTDNIAHDLRSPLARIRGKAEMTLVSKNFPTDCGTMAASTIEECDNLIDMINTMLDITEAEAGVGHTEQETVAINDLMLSACELFEPIANEKGIKLKVVLPESQLYFKGDKHKLQRMVTNLIENGIKYNRPGGTVTVTLKEADRELQILIEDTGIGISEQVLARIFDRFYRCDASRSEPGLGLGLSLAKAIARASGGDIQVKSTINAGSLFIVSLPL